MIDPFTLTDEFGPREVIHLCEPTQSLRAIVVVDNVALGPALVRVRIAPDLPVAECARLARVTTLECATVGLPFGGGQAVVFASPQLDAHRQRTLLRCFGSAFARHRDVIAIPDLGTDETAMAWMYDEGAPVAGRPRALGGIGLEELGVTGLGVFHSARVAVDYCDIPLVGARVAIQGFGVVAQHAARHLVEAGAHVVAVTDMGWAIHSPEGVNVYALASLVRSGHHLRQYPGVRQLSRDELFAVDCDIWIAAVADAISLDDAGSLRARLVVPAVDHAMAPAVEGALHRRGVLCVPDLVATSGGVIGAALELHAATRLHVVDGLRDALGDAARSILGVATREHRAPRDVAVAVATERLEKAMALRRWSVFAGLGTPGNDRRDESPAAAG